MFKLRIYKKNGCLKCEEFFDTREEMDTRYRELFKPELYSLNPTVWELKSNEWQRVEVCS